MKATGCTVTDLESVAKEVGVRLLDLREEGVRAKKINFMLRPIGEGYRKIAFHSGKARRVNAVCFHGHKAFLQTLFLRCPGTAVTSSWYGNLKVSAENLEEVAGRLEIENVGSRMFPVKYREACNCSQKERS